MHGSGPLGGKGTAVLTARGALEGLELQIQGLAGTAPTRDWAWGEAQGQGLGRDEDRRHPCPSLTLTLR